MINTNLQKLINRDPQLAFLKMLINLAIQKINPKKIVLFGSRATATHTLTSDVDLFFDLEGGNEDLWASFCVEAEEILPTLLDIDFVNKKNASKEIINSINHEGIEIYER